ncbi:precorrin-3B C(17)-methyltransferase [Rhodobacteraceae bacterium CCMM004]|nr:precorrin-3B C(17)-methyltransferase [Rhodobacteraceae bacterium CCMM004]
MDVTPVVLALSRSGEATAHRVAAALGAQVHGREGRTDRADAMFPDALIHARDLFAAGVPVVGVCASGILIRAVAPLLSDKRAEPPVVSVSDDGAVAVPLLGGHRGANRLAQRIAAATGGTAAVTTAGDVSLGLALDAPPPGWRLAPGGDAKGAMARLLAGAGAEVAGIAPWLDGLPPAGSDPVRLHAGTGPAAAGTDLAYHPQTVTLGVGCARGCDPGELAELALETLAQAGLSPWSVAAVCSLDLKADEAAVNALARRLDVPLRLFDAAALEAQTPRLANPSEVVFAEVGCHGVAEAAALAAAGPDAALIAPKVKTANATCALAQAPAPLTAVPGRARGRLSVVGIGPGQSAWRTPEASALIARADELVGYGLYLDLLGPLAAGKPRAEFPLGGEEDRCRHALERAGEGRDVALVCSGDAGIYAMAALVWELIDRGAGPGGVTDAARRVEVTVAPGISALQAAAARVGAPLGHDFCAISLSDLLTPREDILRRLRAAAEGDFVVAFYNPVSRRRRTLLAAAREILLAHRPPETPVLLAVSLGRPEERLEHRTLATLAVDEVDMLTLVLVGSSATRAVATGDGPRLYTPRGYAAKLRTGADGGAGGGSEDAFGEDI